MQVQTDKPCSSAKPNTVTVIAISDALGRTAAEVATAAAGQFPGSDVLIERLTKVSSREQVDKAISPRVQAGEAIVVFLTIVAHDLWEAVIDLLADLHVPTVDLMGPAVAALSLALDREPEGVPGTIHRTDESYFKRIEAMEYFVEHDDGRNGDDLSGADIVLLGISRTSKTPLSMYLAFQGYNVANIPLAPGMEPPESIYQVDPARLFGLLSTTDVLADIRDSRLGDDQSRAVAGSYADPSAIDNELEEARALMKRLGCFVVRTDHKAIEESAAEITGRIEVIMAARERRARQGKK